MVTWRFPILGKKTDVAEHQKALDHAGFFVNGPPEKAGLPFLKSSDDLELAE